MTTPPKIQYIANGTQKEFPFPFRIWHNYETVVYLGNEEVEGYDVVVGDGDGIVVFGTAPADGTKVTIYRNLEIKRISDFQEGGMLRSTVLNDEFDYQNALIAQGLEEISRSVKVPVYENESPDELMEIIRLAEISARQSAQAAYGSKDEAAASAQAAVDVVEGFDAHAAEKIQDLQEIADSASDYATQAAASAAASGDWIWRPIVSDRLLESDEAAGFVKAGDRTLLADTTANERMAAAYAGGVDDIFTYGSITFPYRQAVNGWRIALEAYEVQVNALYNELGSADFYILYDDGTVRAPRSYRGEPVYSWREGTEWFEIYANGKCRQGGSVARSASAGGPVTVDFLVPFIDTKFFFLSGYTATTSTNNLYGFEYYEQRTVSSTVIHGFLDRPQFWIAEGCAVLSDFSLPIRYTYYRVGNQIKDAQLVLAEEVVEEVRDLKNNKADITLGNVPEADARSLPGNRVWQSDWFNIATNTAYNFNHDLGLSDPTKAVYRIYGRVKTAQAGWAVGDIVDASNDNQGHTAESQNLGSAFGLYADSTLVAFANHNSFSYISKNGGFSALQKTNVECKLVIFY